MSGGVKTQQDSAFNIGTSTLVNVRASLWGLTRGFGTKEAEEKEGGAQTSTPTSTVVHRERCCMQKKKKTHRITKSKGILILLSSVLLLAHKMVCTNRGRLQSSSQSDRFEPVTHSRQGARETADATFVRCSRHLEVCTAITIGKHSVGRLAEA